MAIIQFGVLFSFLLHLCLLQALGHVLIAKPDFMLNEDIGNIVENALSSDSDSMLKVLSCYIGFGNLVGIILMSHS